MHHIHIKVITLLAFMILFTLSCGKSSSDGYNNALAISAVNQQIEDDITIYYAPYSPDYPSHPCKFLSAYVLNRDTVSKLYPENYDSYFAVQKVDSENWIVELTNTQGTHIEYGPYTWLVSTSERRVSKLSRWQLFMREALFNTKHKKLKEFRVTRIDSNRTFC